MKNKVVNSLWIGDKLSPINIVSINSFLSLDYQYNLYTYDDIENVPSKVNLLDGNDILPDSAIWYYGKGFNKGSPSSFSNEFRYKLLYEMGGLYCDTDFVLLKDFDYDNQDFVFAQEYNSLKHEYKVVSSFMMYSKYSKQNVFKDCIDYINSVDKENLVNSEIGPLLIDKISHKFELWEYMSEVEKFTSVARGWEESKNLITENKIPKDAYGIHLWQARWKPEGISPYDSFDTECVWEQLKRKYL